MYNKKIMTIREYLKWEFEFFHARYQYLRLGQAFVNDHNLEDKILFFETNDSAARDRIYDVYLADEEYHENGDIY